MALKWQKQWRGIWWDFNCFSLANLNRDFGADLDASVRTVPQQY